MRDGFIFYNSFYEALSQLNDVDRLAAYDMISRYALTGEIPEGASGAGYAIFLMAKPQIDANEQRRGRATGEYHRFRQSVIERDDGVCQLCGVKESIMHVHHIKPYALFPQFRTDIDNGITLCPECHRRVHFG